MTKLQASKLSKSADFVRIFCQSNGDQKVSKHACVDYTVLHAMVHPDWPIQMLSVAIASSRAWAARSSIDQPSSPNFALLGDQNPNLSLTSFKRRRNVTARAGEKKHRAVFPPCVQLQVLLNWPSCDDRRCTARRRLIVSKTKH